MRLFRRRHSTDTPLRFLTGPISFMEVGCRGDAWKVVRDFASQIRLLVVEPNNGEREKLARQLVKRPWYSWEIIESALGARGGVQKLSITKQAGLSSLYRPNYAVIEPFEDPDSYQVEKMVSVTLQTLDALASLHHFADGIDLLKVDTQGSEYDILCGATQVLRGTLAVYIEMEFVELYSSQPLFGEIHALMGEQGFYLHDLLRVRRVRRSWAHFSRPQLLYGYGLYVRGTVDNEQAVRLAAVMTMLGYFDAAASLWPAGRDEITEHAVQYAKSHRVSRVRLQKKLHHDRKDEDAF